MKWCPGAESNHRHEDFQSTALPLSYPGTGLAGNGADLGSRCSRRASWCCPVGLRENSVAADAWIGAVRRIGFGGLGWFCRNGVAAQHPPAQIYIGATPRAEGAVGLVGLVVTDRAGHGARISLGSRRRCRHLISNCPSLVQPTRSVSIRATRNAPCVPFPVFVPAPFTWRETRHFPTTQTALVQVSWQVRGHGEIGR